MAKTLEVAVDQDQILVIVHNTDGRPCGWGVSVHESEARKEAERQFKTHRCYLDEKRGKTTTHILPKKEDPR